MGAIIKQWDSYGIIIETQFDFAYQHMFKSSWGTAYEIIVENGGHCVSDTEDGGSVLCAALEIDCHGWMYFFFDTGRLDVDAANEQVIKYFQNKQNSFAPF